MPEQDVKYTQLDSMVQSHHKKIHDLERVNDGTPDPKTLREMEHVFKELPDTDKIKAAIIHADHSNKVSEAITKGFLSHIGTIVWVLIGMGVVAWLQVGLPK